MCVQRPTLVPRLHSFFFLFLFLFFVGKGFLVAWTWNWPSQLGVLSCEPQRVICLCLPSTLAQLFMWILGI